jgi:hypothetical protein
MKSLQNHFQDIISSSIKPLFLRLGDIQTSTASSACCRYGRHNQELHTPLLSQMCALI